MANDLHPLVHSELVAANQAVVAAEPPTAVGTDFPSGQTAVNIRTTALDHVKRPRMGLRLWRIRRGVARMRDDIRKLRTQRETTLAYLTDPDTVEAGREQRLERLLRSTESDQQQNLHPRLGMIGATSAGLRGLRVVLYLAQVVFEFPFLFGLFRDLFGAPESAALLEVISDPKAMAAAALAVIPTVLLILMAEEGGRFLAGLFCKHTRGHVRQFASFPTYASPVAVLGVAVTMFLLANQRFAATSAFQAGSGARGVGEWLIGSLPILMLLVATVLNTPRLVEATQRAQFAKQLRRREATVRKAQAALVRRYQQVQARVITGIYRIQSLLDTVGTIADTQVHVAALQHGVYGTSLPQFQAATTLGVGQRQDVVGPVLGRPTTQLAVVANYCEAEILDLIVKVRQVEAEGSLLRDSGALFSHFRANPDRFLLEPTLNSADSDPQVAATDTPGGIEAELRAVGELLLPAQLEPTPASREIPQPVADPQEATEPADQPSDDGDDDTTRPVIQIPNRVS